MNAAWLLTACLATADTNAKPFVIQVLDDESSRPVPLIELRSVNGVRHYTDSGGLVALTEPGWFGQDIYFHIVGHGYEYPRDGFGYRGKTLRVTPGGEATIKIKRINLAERLYRITGEGIYRDTLLAGRSAPLRQPVLNGLVFGSDSVLTSEFGGRLFWFWGDTNRPSYPLGNFQVSGATSQLPGRGGLDPNVGIDLTYFVDAKGFAKPMARMPGKGPTWITSLVTLKDKSGVERLCASYVKIEPPLKVYARGLAVFAEDKQEFEHFAHLDMSSPLFPDGHSFVHDGYVYFAHPFPVTRVRADAASYLDPSAYEAYTCWLQDHVQRDTSGALHYAWRKNTAAPTPKDESRWLKESLIKPHEARWRLYDRDSGKVVMPHSGSVHWNAYRRRWVMIVVETLGTSALGEVWYAEAETPTGPWSYAVKVVTHDRYSFYNPKHHPYFDKEGGRYIYFEGTYTHAFSGNPEATPRYDYNQIMYRLDLALPRLALPVAIWDNSPGAIGASYTRAAVDTRRPAFYALDHPGVSTVPILATNNGLRVGKPGEADPVFHALTADMPNPPASTAALHEYQCGTSRRYSLRTDEAWPGYQRAPAPLCRVWRVPGSTSVGR
jgi:hypothetical protein